MCDFDDLRRYIEEKLGKPIFIHELADKQLIEEIKLAAKDEFLAICKKDEAAPSPRPNTSALADTLFEFFDEFDVTDLQELSDLEFVSVWLGMVSSICDGTDRDRELREALERWIVEKLRS